MYLSSIGLVRVSVTLLVHRVELTSNRPLTGSSERLDFTLKTDHLLLGMKR